MALFSFKKFLVLDTVKFSFLFDKILSNHGLTRVKRFISRFYRQIVQLVFIFINI
jgi:hypothetical protein